MRLGVIADDFTGASDAANTLVRGFMSTVQSVGIPQGTAPECDALVVSLKTRTIPVAEAVRESLAALEWLIAAGCEQFLFKYCSTFDSTKDGNIGPVAAALRARLDAKIAIVCPVAPSLGRTLYQGNLFVNGTPLAESGMRNHPLTPMTDSDIRRWLAYQTTVPVGLVAYETVKKGAAAVRAALDAAIAKGQGFAVTDAVDDADLLVLGEAVADDVLVTGGSGIGKGLAANFVKSGKAAKPMAEPFIAGPGVALCGSCSEASRRQVKAHAASHPALAISADAVIEKRTDVAGALDFARANKDKSPLIYSSADPAEVRAAQQRYGTTVAAEALESFFGMLAVALRDAGFTRLAIGGGETSGAVVSALGVSTMRVGPEIDPGVPVLTVAGASPYRLALKSGNFGADDFFAAALVALATGKGRG
ncbi:MAG: four-carbon acid sugar kinase family protein [Alphaproteobacteria bacterium]|nr:four-carbon acid sugar kinase family protein [Alphaproteobacteria bacterium]